jgi:hypothetical protein
MPATPTDRLNGLTTSVAVKPACRVGSTANLTLSGLQTVDGIVLVAGDRVLVKNQTDTTENGIYEADTSAWSRAPDFDGARDAVQGTLVIINEGTTTARTVWKVTSENPINIGTDAITFEAALLQDLATVTFTQGGTDPLARDAQSKMRERVTPDDFIGLDKTGTTNSTVALLNFFNYCIATNLPGRILGGTYLITPGVLAFDTPFVDAVWPDIETDGHEAVTFKVDPATATNQPLLAITNGTANSAAGRYWRGGSLGGITFLDETGAVAAGRHGLSLRGIWGTKFGYMRGNDLRGSLFCFPQTLYIGNNPDPYAVSACEFEGIEANRCQRYALENQNWVGFTGNDVKFFRVIEGVLGGWYGLGAGNRCNFASLGSVAGWAFDDGTNLANTGGSPSRFRLDIAELDDVQNGFRFNKLSVADIEQVRFIHRYNFSSLNPGEGYWPRKAFEISGGVAPAITSINIEAQHRIEVGGLKADMGRFIDFSGIACTNVVVEQRILDNAALGFVSTDLYTNLNVNSSVRLTKDNIVIADRLVSNTLLAAGDGTTAIPNAGYGTAAAMILMPTEAHDRAGNYASGVGYTVPYAGLYFVKVGFTLNTGAAGTRVRLGVLRNRAGVLLTVAHRTVYSVSANAETYEVCHTLDLNAGDIIYPQAEQNTGTASIVCAPVFTQGAENVFQVRAL